MADTIMPEKMGSRSSLNVTVFSSSVHQYVNYSKKMQIRLAELNNNVSNVIKESCSGIDNICNRVRQCLNEMDQRYKPVHVSDEVTEYDIMEEKSRSCEDLSQEIDETEDLSIVDTIEEEKVNTEQNSEIMPSLTPFFTEINCNNDDPDNRESCRKQVLNKTIYSLLNRDKSPHLKSSDSRISLDDFKGTISTLCNNFEVMNVLVENINKEITKFSETTLNVVEKNVEEIKSKEINKTISGLKQIKRLSKSNSRQKSVQVGDCASDTEVDFIELDNKNSSSFLLPDVYRKRAFTDLYQKLVTQVEANDSLIFFQTLMKRHKSLDKNKRTLSQIKMNIPIMNYSIPKNSLSNSSNHMGPPKKVDLSKKYANSLWFSQRAMVRERSRSDSRKGSRKTKKATARTVESRTLNLNLKKKTTGSESNKSQKHKCNSNENFTKKACSLECTCRMVVHNDMPASPSTKCHQQWLRATPHATYQRKLKFLDILDDLTYRDLLPLQSEYPRKDHHQARELDHKNIHDTYLYKLLYGKQCSKDVWKQLLEPTSQTPKIYKAVKTLQTPNPKKTKEEKMNDALMEKFCSQNYSKSDILKRLSPYIYDSEKTQENYGQSVIVMPVRVYYDNFKTNEPPTKLESPKKPFVSALRKVPAAPLNGQKWGRQSNLSTPKITKPMRVVYDSLPKKQGISPIAASIKPYAMPWKPLLINSARLNVETKSSKKFSSKSFPPKGFASYCENVRNGKKGPTEEDNWENVAIYKKIQADIEKIKEDIYGNKVNLTDKKLWAHKYGKSVGQKLISFVQHQKTEEEKPLPIYALPKLEILSPLPEKSLKMNFPVKSNPQKQVLQHIQNIKAKNETIQTNLKKAIEVIETRMVDILCDDSKSIQAFNVMEKEITNVLSLMKCQGRTDLKSISSKSWNAKDEGRLNSTRGTNGSLEENYNIISEHLFERLERILDTGGSSMSNTSVYRTNQVKQLPKKIKEEPRKKQKLSSCRRTKTNIISPSSSASMEETVINRRLPKVAKKTDRIEVQPQLSASTIALVAKPIPSDNWENTCGDQNSIKNAPIESESRSDSKITEEDKSQNCEDHSWHNSSGDFVKQEDMVQKSDVSLDNAELKDITIDREVDGAEKVNSAGKVNSDEEIEKHIVEEGLENNVKEVNSAYKINSDDDIEKHIIENEPESGERTEKRSEILLDDVNIEQTTDTFESLLNSDVEEFINDELNKVIDSIASLGEQTDMEQTEPIERQLPKENLELTDHCTPHGESLENRMQVAIKEDPSNYNEEVHKILKRMENIYSQLDDIQESESVDKIPVFREADILSVQSEIFLTPFMQAVKETRKTTKQNSKMALIEKSPSYYNVINFLDALTNLQKETPYEVYTAKMHNYAHVYDQVKVYDQSAVLHEVQYSSSTSSKAGCLKKKSDDSKQIKQRKVSFLQTVMEDKSNQVRLCPVHKVRVLRISSQQFPPMETTEEDRDENRNTEVTNEKTERKEDGNDVQTYSWLNDSYDSNNQQTASETIETLSCEALGHLEIKGGHDETREPELSVIDDKSTQVFCLMQAAEKLEENSITDSAAEEYKCPTSNDDPFVDCPVLEENPDDSKSTERDFLDDSLQDPFYDYTNQTVTPKGVMQKIEGIYEEGKNAVQVQPRIVVFREVLESPLPLPKDFKDVNDIEQYKKRLEKRKEIRLMRQTSSEMVRRKIETTRPDTENMMLLKSFYAIVYILMFTALSLDYRCI